MRHFASLIPFSLLPLVCGACLGSLSAAQSAAPLPPLVERALAAELSAAQDDAHPMRYQLRKSSARLTTTKDMIESGEGQVALLVAVNDRPLSDADQRKESARLDELLADPSKQHRKKQQQADDTARALKVLRALPEAFVYQEAGTVSAGSVTAQRFVFNPKRGYSAPDLETHVLTAMDGEIWIDPVHGRVLRLQAKLHQDVDFGWGVLGRLYKGGWITIDQADVNDGAWRIVKFQMSMSARILLRTRSFGTVEEESHFSRVPQGMDYRQAIAMLRAGRGDEHPNVQ